MSPVHLLRLQAHEQRPDAALVSRLESELAAARREVDSLQGAARAAAALRDELACKTAALEESREELLRLERLRAEELQVGVGGRARGAASLGRSNVPIRLCSALVEEVAVVG